MQWFHHISRRARRGVSLLEMLVAIGVVIAVAAVVIPWSAGWLGGRELDNAEDNLAMQMVMARAAAREEGRPVEVVADSTGGASRVRARWMSGNDDGRDGDFERSARPDGADAFGAGSQAFSQPWINASWANLNLPHGVRVALGLESSDALPEPAVGGESDESLDGTTGGQTLAIFLPDGTVFFAPVFMLRTDAGSLRAMKVDRATGVPQAVEHAPVPSTGDAERPEFDGFDLDVDDEADGPIAP